MVNFRESFQDINKAFDRAAVYGLPSPAEKVLDSQLYSEVTGGLLVAEDVDIDFLRFVERYLYSVFKPLIIQQTPVIKLPAESQNINLSSSGHQSRQDVSRNSSLPSGFVLDVFEDVMPTLVGQHETPQTFNAATMRETIELEIAKSHFARAFRQKCDPFSFRATGNDEADLERLFEMIQTIFVELAGDFFGEAGMGGKGGGRAYSPQRAVMWLKAFWTLEVTVKADREYQEILLKIDKGVAEAKCGTCSLVQNIGAGGAATGFVVLCCVGTAAALAPVAGVVTLVVGLTFLSSGVATFVVGKWKGQNWEKVVREKDAVLNPGSSANAETGTRSSSAAAAAAPSIVVEVHRPTDGVLETRVLEVLKTQILRSECGGGRRSRTEVIADFRNHLDSLVLEHAEEAGILRPLVEALEDPGPADS